MAIVINSTTGEIDLDQTTPNTYVVTYTVQGVSSTQEVTVNAVDNAAFSYSASSYEPTDADPTPTITGLTGGTFSAGSGLVFVDSGTNTGSSTGEIDLSASTIASYTITYDTTSSGSSVCPNTSTQTVEIAVAGIANNYSMSFDSASSDYIDCGNDNSLDITGSLSISFWIYGQTNTTHTGVITKTPNTTSISSNAQYHIQFQSSNQLRFVVTGCDLKAGTETTGTIPTVDVDSWQHFIMTWNGTDEMIVYKNGVEVATKTQSTTIVSNTSDLLIGHRQGYGYLDGQLDEVAIWNTALTSTQVSEIYYATSTNLTKDLTTVSGSNLIYWNRMGD